MGKQSEYPQAFIKIVADVFTVLLSWFLSYYLRFYVLPGAYGEPFELFFSLGVYVVLLFLYFLNRNGLYSLDLSRTWRKEASLITYSCFQVFVFLIVTLYFVYSTKVSRIALLIHFALSVILIIVERTLLATLFNRAFRKGWMTKKVLLVGYGKKLTAYADAVSSLHSRGIQIVGQYDGGEYSLEGIDQVTVPSLIAAVEATHADLVVIAYPSKAYARQQKAVTEGMDMLHQDVILLPSIPQSYVGTRISDFHFIPMLKLNAPDIGIFVRIIKRLFDIFSSIIAIIFFSPAFLLVPILIKLSSPGPVLFKQKRVTENDEVFTMYKFRSMRCDIVEGNAHWTEENDPRVTRLGSFLRRTSIDEIPQFFNVLGGSMSLIGPRPERPELENQFEKKIPGYKMRHKMKAGITGWAQVNGLRGNTSLEKRIEFDLFYIRNWTMWFDIKIIVFTFLRGFVNKNAY